MPDPDRFPLGAAVTVADLEGDPHPTLASLRSSEPVSWLVALDGWLVTRYDVALQAMRDAHMFTVDDRRFSTAQVVGASMLSLDGEDHARQRAPFVGPFRPSQVRERFAAAVAQEVDALLDELAPAGRAELRRAFAGPLATSTVARALGLSRSEVAIVLAWYDAIVASVTSITAGRGPTPEGAEAFAALGERLQRVIDAGGQDSLLAAAVTGSGLTRAELVSNAAVLLFGGIETTEGMIANAALALLERPDAAERVRRQPALVEAAVEESLRLEPAAAVIDRYATADTSLAGVDIAAGDLVRISIAGANRDPEVFEQPDEFELSRPVRRQLAFAQGPHVCVGVHLARLEGRLALSGLLARLPRLRLDPEHRAQVRGLVFRKPSELRVVWG